MARIKYSPLVAEIRGSVGSSTIQKSLGGSSLRLKPLPSSRSTYSRQINKSRVSVLLGVWHSFTEQQRLLWAQFATYSQQSLSKDSSKFLNGYNVFLKYNLIRLASGLSYITDPEFSAPQPPSITPTVRGYHRDLFIAGGVGTYPVQLSTDGVNWTPADFVSPGTSLSCIAWNGRIFVAGGLGTNSLLYSYDGVNWLGIGNSIFDITVNDIAWNGNVFVAVGNSGNTIAWSGDGITWHGLGQSIITSVGYSVVWDGTKFIVGGAGTNTLAWSYDGKIWTGLGASVFTSYCRSLSYFNGLYLAGGRGGSVIATSTDGFSWVNTGTSVFSTYCSSFSFNGTTYVAGGSGTNSLATSSNGTSWSPVSSPPLSSNCQCVRYNGKLFVAVGDGSSSLAYSSDGFSWIGTGTSVFSDRGLGVLAVSDPNYVPVIIPPLIINFNALLQGNNTFALVKISPKVKATLAFQSNRTRVVVLNYSHVDDFNIAEQVYELFGSVPAVDDWVMLEITLFDLTSAKSFPSLKYVQQVIQE